MKIKLIQLSLITSLALSLNASTIESVNNWNTYPIPQEVTSKSRGGTLADKEAISDGVGSIVVKSINVNSQTLNNEEYNKLLLLNKDKLTNTVGLKELIANGDIVIDSSTLNSINGNGLSNPTGLPANGTSCNDNNPLTINDIYTNNVCVGTSIVGTSCDDGNAQTSDDKYDANGVCVGVFVDGTVCDDSNKDTINDKYTNGVCIGTMLQTTALLGYIPTYVVYEGYPYTNYKTYNAKIFERDTHTTSEWGSWSTGVIQWIVYWYQPGRYIEMDLPDGAIIYTRNETNWNDSASLNVTKNGVSVNVWISNTTRGKNWAQSTIPLSAGRYKFSNDNGQIRIDSDWYIHIPNTNTIPPI